ncbi:TIGR04283 family arsenosugar biosynthesis glycosyltransferase [Tropicimonas marinistellae]|uniref:TIGR04283 family arsenosugar biosynthesis glycosyltransferase n=1 Tax=Tropicimonas marinistellae TaxID=1739787 RepID=UPI00082B6071|nr:TIGR04283 family arsenosugar biosynthesis glycosyltransferase [Tropicimonas marinistellae]
MPAPVSVVIPTLDAEPALKEMLPGVFDGVAAGLVREVIVTDGGSTDDTEALAEAVGARFIPGPAGRGGQLRRGCAAARGAWLLILHADTHLPPGWVENVRAAMASPDLAHAFRLSFRASGAAPRIVAGWANLRSRLFRLPYGDQGLLLTRGRYEAAGGFPEIPLMEDVALARALGRGIRLMPANVSTSAARYEAEGWLRRGSRNLSNLVRYRCGAPPEQLARRYASEDESASLN